MQKLATVLFAAAAFAFLPADARAQGYFNVFYSYSYDGAAGECPSVWSDCPNRPTGWGLATGSFGTLFGFEAEYGWTSDFFVKSSDIVSNKVRTLMTHVLFGPRLGPVRVYGASGFGAMKASVDFANSNLEDYSDSSWGYDYGAGLMLVFPAHLGLRFDYRRFHSSAEVPYGGLGPGTTPFEFSRTTFGIVLH